MRKIILAFTMVISAGAFGATGFLDSEKVVADKKYCHYSNGITISVASGKQCPSTMDQ